MKNRKWKRTRTKEVDPTDTRSPVMTKQENYKIHKKIKYKQTATATMRVKIMTTTMTSSVYKFPIAPLKLPA